MKKIPQDIVGNIAILKFKKTTPWLIKKYKAWHFLKNHKSITTVVEKVDKFSGELRIPKTKYLAGIRTSKTTYKENNSIFNFDINKTYFSSRLSNERKIISEEVVKLVKRCPNTPQNGVHQAVPKILVCFAGIAPYPIAIAKQLKKQNKKAKIISNELNPDACLYAKENIKLNKVQDYVNIVCDDAKNLPSELKQKFDIILMPRPNLKETFLKEILKMSKKGTKIFYHGFGTKDSVLSEIKKDTKNKIGKITIRKAGDIGPKIYRWQCTFKVK